MKGAVQELPEMSGIAMANWNWKVVRQFLREHFGISLSRSSCLNYLHRLGFVLKRPKKRLVKADQDKRESFVADYAARWDEARRTGAKIFFADEAHFRADAELGGKWVLKGKPALVNSTSPRYGEKASYYSAVCLETGEVEWMELEGNSNSGTSAAFLDRLRQRHSGPLDVIWDNAPAHRGEAVREYKERETPSIVQLRNRGLPGTCPQSIPVLRRIPVRSRPAFQEHDVVLVSRQVDSIVLTGPRLQICRHTRVPLRVDDVHHISSRSCSLQYLHHPETLECFRHR